MFIFLLCVVLCRDDDDDEGKMYAVDMESS